MIKDGDLYAAGGPLPLPVLAVCNGGEYLNRLTNPPSPEDPDERRMLGALAPEARCVWQHVRLCFTFCGLLMNRPPCCCCCCCDVTTLVGAVSQHWCGNPRQPARCLVLGLSSGKAGA